MIDGRTAGFRPTVLGTVGTLAVRTTWIAFLAFVLALAGCAKKTVTDAATASGETAKAGSLLAYEHTASISIPMHELKERMDSVREACADERFGNCSLLRFEEASGPHPRGLVEVRIVPIGVEPMVGLAAGMAASDRDGHGLRTSPWSSPIPPAKRSNSSCNAAICSTSRVEGTWQLAT